MPEPQAPTQPLDITNEQASDTAAMMNADNHTDAYGASWSQSSVLAAHSNSDPNQRKRLLYLLALYAQAIG